MLVIVAALGAAAAWGFASTFDNRSTRMIGALQAMAWVQLIGFALVLPARRSGRASPRGLRRARSAWIVIGGVGITVGITLAYAALARGAVSVVAPVMAIEGALAALLSVALGEHIALATAGGLAIVVAGMLAVLHATAAQERAGVLGHSLTAALLAGGAAIGFAVFLVAVIRAGDALGDAQLQLLYRIVPFAAVGLPLLVRGQLGLPGQAWAWLTAAAALQTAGLRDVPRRRPLGGHRDPFRPRIPVRRVRDHRRRGHARRAAEPPPDRRLRRPPRRRRGGRRDARVTGIVGGLLAALLWGSSTVTDARATRIVGSLGVLGWSSIAGCMLTLPVALVFAHDGAGVNVAGLTWLSVSSLAAVAAFAPFYRAVQLGPVPLVAGLGATEGGVAAAISFATGERLPALTLAGPPDRARGHDLRAHVRAHAGAARAMAARCRRACSRPSRPCCSGSRSTRAPARSTTCPSSGCPRAAAPSERC